MIAWERHSPEWRFVVIGIFPTANQGIGAPGVDAK